MVFIVVQKRFSVFHEFSVEERVHKRALSVYVHAHEEAIFYKLLSIDKNCNIFHIYTMGPTYSVFKFFLVVFLKTWSLI